MTSSATIRVPVTQTQAEFLTCPAREAIYRGGLGAGKTRVLAMWAGARACQERVVLLTEPTYPMVRDVLLPTLEEVLALQGLPYTKNLSSYTLKVGGGTIFLRSGERPDNLRGINAHDAGADEASYTKEEVRDALIGRTRKSEDAQLRFVGTPRGRDWVYKYGTEGEAVVFTQSTFANPFLPASYKAHLARQYPEHLIRQELLGEIIDFGAGILKGSWLKAVAFVPFQAVGRARAWDLAATEGSHGDYTAGVLLATDYTDWAIADIVRGRWEWPKARTQIIATAKKDGAQVPIVVEAFGQQKALLQDLQHAPELAGHLVVGLTPRGSKFNKAISWGARAEQGRFSVVAGANVAELRDEMTAFSHDDSHPHDDMLDGVSLAYIYLLDNPPGASGRTLGLYA